MTVHGIAPEAFLEFVHDIDHSAVPASPELAFALKTLPGRKLVFTNGTCYHAERVLDRLGIRELVDDVFDIVHCDFIPKPQREPYMKFVERTGIAPKRAAMFEDIARNLEPPHELGMTTVLVQSPENTDGNIINAPLGDPAAAPFIDHVTSDLLRFFRRGCRLSDKPVRSAAMKTAEMQSIIDEAFEARAELTPKTKGKVRKAVVSALKLLDSGTLRVARRATGHGK